MQALRRTSDVHHHGLRLLRNITKLIGNADMCDQPESENSQEPKSQNKRRLIWVVVICVILVNIDKLIVLKVMAYFGIRNSHLVDELWQVVISPSDPFDRVEATDYWSILVGTQHKLHPLLRKCCSRPRHLVEHGIMLQMFWDGLDRHTPKKYSLML